ncbi:MAG: hypothetical protein ABSH22_22880 [Tepidisphaeraceae bacterium]
METVTTKCSVLKHPEFHVKFDCAIPDVDVHTLVSFLEQSVKGGTHYQHGQLIELGSMIFRLVAVNGYLETEEPDLLGFPITWREGVTNSLRLLRLQKDIAESVGLGDNLDFPSIRQGLLVGADLLDGSNTFVSERLHPEGTDSGWFIGRPDSQLDYNEPRSLRRISVYQAILGWPHISGFLALPEGIRVEAPSGRLQISRNGKPLEIRKGSFLDVGSS